ncbi:MAG: DMT family transporter [Gemmatimonadota bacterium]|nr:DMT family transporter [Gemmatimonadota bacterium]
MSIYSRAFLCGDITTLTGFLFLIAATLVTSCFGLVLKSADHTGRNPVAVGSLNYIIGAVLTALALFFDPDWSWSLMTVLVGGVTGVFYVVAFWFLVRALMEGGVAVTLALVRLSVLIPILCSIFIWSEIPNFAQTVGIGVVCIALPFLSLGVGQAADKTFKGTVWMVGALFITTGMCHLSPKVFSEMAPQSQMSLYLFSLFSVAAIMSILYIRFKPVQVRRNDYGYGLLQGVINVTGTWLLVITLKLLPGTIVFPVSSALGLVVTTSAAVLIWKEKIRRPAYVGIGLTFIALILVNSK